MRKKMIIDKKVKKKTDGRCYFCPENDYSLLDVHRIVEGKDGGRYTQWNTITVCCKCHRKIHAGHLKIDRKYYATNGHWVLRYWDKDEEKWL